MATKPNRNATPTTRERLLSAAFGLVRTKGYNATTVDDLCAAAGVTKGAFFHYFASKEDLAVAAADHWSAVTGARFAEAPYHALKSARDRVLGYVDFRTAILQGTVPEFTCLVGTLAQEVHVSSPPIRDACARSIVGHAATLEADIAEALAVSSLGRKTDAHGLALHTQAVLQGAFILAKATQDTAVAAASIAHLRAYLEHLFAPAPRLPGDETRVSRRHSKGGTGRNASANARAIDERASAAPALEAKGIVKRAKGSSVRLHQ